jgi:putative FmdB family regulatory protein
MPTYGYLCQTCSHHFETWQKMTDESLTVCPECGKHIRRVLYPAGIVFKGAGFYKTDHGNGAHGANGANSEDQKVESPTTETSTNCSSAVSATTTKSSERSASTTTGVK